MSREIYLRVHARDKCPTVMKIIFQRCRESFITVRRVAARNSLEEIQREKYFSKVQKEFKKKRTVAGTRARVPASFWFWYFSFTLKIFYCAEWNNSCVWLSLEYLCDVVLLLIIGSIVLCCILVGCYCVFILRSSILSCNTF